MDDKKIEKQAYDLFASGFGCSESVFRAISENFGRDTDSSMIRVTSGLTGGMGSSHEETCGALTGGIVALGYLYGRTDPNEDHSGLKAMVVEYRERFIREFGSTNCGVLLERFGDQGDDDFKCRELTGKAAGILARLLEEYRG